MRGVEQDVDQRKPGAIYVCSFAGLDDAVALSSGTYLVSLINAQMMSELKTPRGIDPARHLRLIMNDIEAPQDGMILPNAAHVDQLIAFAREWARQAPLLINCRAGRSRSTAAAFIIECALNPDMLEDDIAAALRAASGTAQPNRLLIKLADEALKRDGRMIAAIERIGAGDAAHNHVFRLR
ncbi:MAG: protein tyrosine phosphatase [Hyphomicrobiales bacterium]|nr:protein tyrosine phosphatase [Hyphomicrobiales bacterium]